MALKRDELIYLAKVSEQTERYEDMTQYMKKVVTQFKDPMTTEERNMISVAFKNKLGAFRTALRGINNVLLKDQRHQSGNNMELVKQLKKKIEDESDNLCNEVISLIDQNLLPSAQGVEEKVFYNKLKADYFRYISEYAQGDYNKQVGQKALAAYTAATEQAASLQTTHPIRLGLALNSSVFYYEVMKDPVKACSIAKNTFDDAIADIQQIDEEQYQDATIIMQLLRDNLTLWTSDVQDDDNDVEAD